MNGGALGGGGRCLGGRGGVWWVVGCGSCVESGEWWLACLMSRVVSGTRTRGRTRGAEEGGLATSYGISAYEVVGGRETEPK